MIRITNKDTGEDLGAISEDQMQFLEAELEEESDEDRDYYISREMLAVLKDRGAPGELLRILGDAIGNGQGVEIAWSSE
jgi:hypothetical protein